MRRQRSGPFKVTGLTAWINADSDALLSQEKLGVVQVDGREVGTLGYQNEQGYKTTGVLDLAKGLSNGIHSIHIVLTAGKAANGAGVRMYSEGEATPAGAGAYVNCEDKTSANLTQYPIEFQIDLER